ncbi:MAG TPA: ABC transporter permease [Alkalispirochaeta sp.]|nr:ABC transporter permease [Alkalispirochaeta sp.]
MTLRWTVSLVLHTAAVVFLVATGSFFLLQIIPGDPAAVVAGMDAAPATVDAVRVQLGLDAPWYVRYAEWIAGVMRGSFGDSYVQRVPVAQLIAQRVPVTAALAGLALVMSIAAAVVMALVSRIGRVATVLVRVIEYASFAFPQFWVGLLLLSFFGLHLGWFPIVRGEGLGRLVLPAVALSLGNAAVLSRTIRAGLAEQLKSAHVVAARSLGVPRMRIAVVHVLPLALIPAVAVIAIQAGYLLAGAIVVEHVFSIPGLGRLALTAIGQRDLPLIQAVVVVFGVAFPLFSMLGDLILGALWPRLRQSKS